MGATYTRQSSYTDGDVIQAADTNNEFDQLIAVFNESTGHTHDGTSQEGGPITKLLGNTLTFGAGTSGTDVTVTFDGETNDGVLKWMEDEDYFEFSDDILIASTEKLQFRDTAIYLNSSTDGQLDIVADTLVQVATAAFTVDASGDITLDAGGADVVLKDDGTQYGALTNTSGNLIIKSGTTTAMTFSGANVTFAGTVTIGSAEISEAELEILDGATVTTTELNIMDGDTSATSTTVADADRVVFNDAGTMKQVAVTDLAAYFDDEITAMPNLVTTAATTVGALNSGSITSGFGTIDTGSSTITTTGLISGGSLDIDDVLINGTTIGHTDDTDLITLANGVVTVAGEVSMTTLDIGGTNVTSTAAELNIVDGGTSATSTTVADADRVVMNDNGTMVQVAVTDLAAYFDDEITAMPNLVTTAATTVGALNSGSITSGFGTIDTGSSTITTTGAITGGSLVADNITIDGTEIDLSSGDLTIDVAGDIILDADGDDIKFNGSGNLRYEFKLDSTPQMNVTGGNFDIQNQTDDANIIFKGSDGGSAVTALTLDMSAAGAATFNSTVTATGTSVFASLDISGDIDVDGTTNLDVTNIVGDLTVTGDSATFTSANAEDPLIIIKDTTNDANAARLRFVKDKGAAGADDDDIGTIEFFADNDAQEQTKFALIRAEVSDASDGAEGGKLNFQVASHDGEMAPGLILRDGSLEDEVDVNIAFGTASVTTIAGNLNVVTDLDVDGTTNLDVVDVDGAVNFAADVTFADGADIITATAGTSNFRAGVNAGNSILSGGNYNTVVGDEAGTAITTGDENVFVGYVAGDAISTASGNTALGAYALTSDTLGSLSVAIGNNALNSQNFTTATNAYNVAIGKNAGLSVTTGTLNTLIGGLAGDALTDAFENTAVGESALSSDTLGRRTVAIGSGALQTQNITTTATNSYNVAVGYDAGNSITTGVQNTIIGALAGHQLTTGQDNVAVGYSALTSDDVGSRTTAIGRFAGYNQNYATATNSNNVYVGYYAGANVLTATNNTLIGTECGDALTTGSENVAVGTQALSTEDAHGQNTAVGMQAFRDLDVGADGNNTALGHIAGRLATTTEQTTLVGAQAGSGAIMTGNSNTAVGFKAGHLITSGTLNTLMGANAGDAISTGFDNVAVGRSALTGEDTGRKNVAIGSSALEVQNNDVDNFNTAVGFEAGKAVSTSIQNTLIGARCGESLTSGSFNTMVGYLAGGFSVDTEDGTKNTIVGSFSHTSATDSDNQIVLGHDVTGNGDNTLCFGTGATDSSIAFGATSITAPSDERFKEDIQTSTAGLSFVNDLRPVTFKWKKEKDVPSNSRSYIEGSEKRVMNCDDKTMHGFIAQEVKTAIDNHAEIKDGFRMWSEGEGDGSKRQRLAPSELIPILTKAIQELSAKNDALEARIATLEG